MIKIRKQEKVKNVKSDKNTKTRKSKIIKNDKMQNQKSEKMTKNGTPPKNPKMSDKWHFFTLCVFRAAWLGTFSIPGGTTGPGFKAEN